MVLERGYKPYRLARIDKGLYRVVVKVSGRGLGTVSREGGHWKAGGRYATAAKHKTREAAADAIFAAYNTPAPGQEAV